MNQQNGPYSGQNGSFYNNQKNNQQNKDSNALTPQQIAVIAALATNALTVRAVLVDNEQNVEIVLQGNLRKQTQLEKIIDKVSEMPFGDVIDAFMNRKK
ncbi:hypothetical protein PQ478_15760 [Alkalihalophilus pseudofirmus]|uniref:hypothetical protein n=1 Tax=Alkalihalophilus pseudofirmus TaxID=79885 RepID=UPI00259B11D4|nr:hypothetical protein [Alkalihalophilus pseudofirmus]WEG15958.1 hypothetical protein PQ478_15760 [Alkalihalophilus pseudofirmus]